MLSTVNFRPQREGSGDSTSSTSPTRKRLRCSSVRYSPLEESTTAENSATGQRYIHHREKGSRVLLFVREFKAEARFGGAGACIPIWARRIM